MRDTDEKIRVRYTTASGRCSERSLWRSQLASAVKRNTEKGITDTEWRPFGAGEWRKP